MINILLAMGLGGSAVTALWLLLYPAARDRFSPRWHDGALKLALALFLLPLGPILSALSSLAARGDPTPPVYSGAVGSVPSAGAAASAAPLPELASPLLSAGTGASPPITLPREGLALLALLWAAGALALLLYKTAVRLRFTRRLRALSTRDLTPATAALAADCARAVGYRGRVTVLVSPLANTPFAMGLLRPAVVLPAGHLAPEELRYILLHELTHIKRGDLWVRALSVAAQTIHWYNPFVHVLSRRLKEVSELVYDALTTRDLSRRERYEYGRLLLRSAAGRMGDWAAPMSSKGTVKRRLSRMFYGKGMTRGQRTAAVLAAVALLTCGCAAALAARNGLVAMAAGSTPLTAVTTEPAQPPKGGADAVPDASATPDVPPAETVSPTQTPETALSEVRVEVSQTPAADAEPPAAQPAAEPAGDDLALRAQAELEAFQRVEEAARAEAEAMDLPGQVAAANLTYPYPTLEELLTIPAVAAWRANGDSTGSAAGTTETPYPRNASGETYGPHRADLWDTPDLIASVGTHGEEGYIRESDYLHYGVDTRTDAILYQMLLDYLPNGYLIPLYDCEGEAIGWFLTGGGGSVT